MVLCWIQVDWLCIALCYIKRESACRVWESVWWLDTVLSTVAACFWGLRLMGMGVWLMADVANAKVCCWESEEIVLLYVTC